MTFGLFVLHDEFFNDAVGQWIASFDVDAFDGAGTVTFTHDPSRALSFRDPAAALLAWRSQSTVRPLRLDGEPNRPLTAYTCDVRPIPESVL